MDIGPFLVADAQSAELTQPGKGAFYHPPPSAQSATVLGVALCQERQNMPGTQTLPDGLRVITTVA